MAGLAYSRPNPEKIVLGIEALLRKELGSPTTLPYQIFTVEGTAATAKSVLKDMGNALARTKQQSVPLFSVHFSLLLPRPFEAEVSVIRYGLGACVQRFAYTVPLEKPLQGAVRLGETKGLSYGGFTGDAAISASLNSKRELVVAANRLAVARTTIGRLKLTIPKHLEIAPRQSGSVLILHRLGVPGFFGGANIGAKDLFTFLPQLEACLS
jgi:hypothetical protein